MGWFFKRKQKVGQVPFPQGHSATHGNLTFPEKDSKERVIAPNRVKEAVGSLKDVPPASTPEETQSEQQETESFTPPKSPRAVFSGKKEPIYVKVQIYQQLLGELDGLRLDLNHLSEKNRALENSEFNEEANFGKLKKMMKSIHDQLLSADKLLFN